MLPEQLVYTSMVTTLRKPETLRLSPEHGLVVFGSDLDLRSNSSGTHREHREIGMRGGAGEDFYLSQFLKLPESLNQVAIIMVKEGVAHLTEPLILQASQSVKRGLRGGSCGLFFCEFNEAPDPP